MPMVSRKSIRGRKLKDTSFLGNAFDDFHNTSVPKSRVSPMQWRHSNGLEHCFSRIKTQQKTQEQKTQHTQNNKATKQAKEAKRNSAQKSKRNNNPPQAAETTQPTVFVSSGVALCCVVSHPCPLARSLSLCWFIPYSPPFF